MTAWPCCTRRYGELAKSPTRETSHTTKSGSAAPFQSRCTSGKPGAIAFGSTVVVRERGGATIRLRIVGEDEANPARGTIAWTSPYAEALIGHRAGDRVVVQRPAGPAAIVVDSVETL